MIETGTGAGDLSTERKNETVILWQDQNLSTMLERFTEKNERRSRVKRAPILGILNFSSFLRFSIPSLVLLWHDPSFVVLDRSRAY